MTFFKQDFFRKNGVAVMTIRELFDFIVDPSITDDSVDSYLEEVFTSSHSDILSSVFFFLKLIGDHLLVYRFKKKFMHEEM